MFFELQTTSEGRVDFYFKKMNEVFRFFPIWNALQSKSDYGLDGNAYVDQLLAKDLAEQLARALGANCDKAMVITAMAGSYFPPKGHQGELLIKEYIKEHQIEISEEDVPRLVLEFAVNRKGIIVSTQLDELLKAVFAAEPPENISTEAAIARYCQDIIKKARIVRQFSNVNWRKLIHASIDEAIAFAKTHQALVPLSSLEEAYRDASQHIQYPPLPDGVKDYMRSGIDIFSLREQSRLFGIARFAASPDGYGE